MRRMKIRRQSVFGATPFHIGFYESRCLPPFLSFRRLPRDCPGMWLFPYLNTNNFHHRKFPMETDPEQKRRAKEASTGAPRDLLGENRAVLQRDLSAIAYRFSVCLLLLF